MPAFAGIATEAGKAEVDDAFASVAAVGQRLPEPAEQPQFPVPVENKSLGSLVTDATIRVHLAVVVLWPAVSDAVACTHQDAVAGCAMLLLPAGEAFPVAAGVFPALLEILGYS